MGWIFNRPAVPLLQRPGWDRRGGRHDVGSPPHLRVIFALGRLIRRPSLFPLRRIDSGLR